MKGKTERSPPPPAALAVDGIFHLICRVAIPSNSTLRTGFSRLPDAIFQERLRLDRRPATPLQTTIRAPGPALEHVDVYERSHKQGLRTVPSAEPLLPAGGALV